MTTIERSGPPDITDLLRRDVIDSLRKSSPSMSAADRRRIADEMLEMAKVQGERMRRQRLLKAVEHLRADLKQRGLRGAYPKTKWRKLRHLEAELATAGGIPHEQRGT